MFLPFLFMVENSLKIPQINSQPFYSLQFHLHLDLISIQKLLTKHQIPLIQLWAASLICWVMKLDFLLPKSWILPWMTKTLFPVGLSGHSSCSRTFAWFLKSQSGDLLCCLLPLSWFFSSSWQIQPRACFWGCGGLEKFFRNVFTTRFVLHV